MVECRVEEGKDFMRAFDSGRRFGNTSGWRR
jgi:hypothetical protein